MDDNSQRIEQIQTILRAGAKQVTNDGTTVVYDFPGLRKELRNLQQSDDSLRGRRPTFLGMKFGGLS